LRAGWLLRGVYPNKPGKLDPESPHIKAWFISHAEQITVIGKIRPNKKPAPDHSTAQLLSYAKDIIFWPPGNFSTCFRTKKRWEIDESDTWSFKLCTIAGLDSEIPSDYVILLWSKIVPGAGFWNQATFRVVTIFSLEETLYGRKFGGMNGDMITWSDSRDATAIADRTVFGIWPASIGPSQAVFFIQKGRLFTLRGGPTMLVYTHWVNCSSI